nr:PAS domain S-box protein [uncultured Methanoregula sp.]
MYSILYIDDDDTLLKLNKLYLEKTGEFTVAIASSAQDALVMMRNTLYDAVLSDYQMPGMDGIELLKEIRREYGRLPFLLFTGKGREEIVIEAHNNGADFYIQKGPDIKAMIAELKHKLSSAIERRRTEDALQKSRQQLTDIINFLPDPTFVIDGEGTVIAWNNAIEKMTGVRKSEILGKGNYEYAIPFIGTRKPLLIDAVMREPYLQEMPYTNTLNEDNKITAEEFSPFLNEGKGANLLISAGPLYDPAGKIVGAIETIRDITVLRTIKRDLDITREKNQGLINMFPVAVAEMDLSCNLTFANNQAYELFGAAHGVDLKQISIFDFIAPQDRNRMRTAVGYALDGKKSTGSEFLLQKYDGTTFPALIYGERIRDPDSGEPAGYRAIVIDLTEKKKEALALCESQGRLQLALEAGNIGVWDVDLQKKQVRDLSRWVDQMMGYDLDQPVLSVERCITFVHPLDLPQIILAFRDYTNGKKPLFECCFRSRCQDGTWKKVVIRGQVIEQDGNGEPVRITGIIHAVNDPVKSPSPAAELQSTGWEKTAIPYNP